MILRYMTLYYIYLIFLLALTLHFTEKITFFSIKWTIVFKNKMTNAKTERLNGKIQRFFSANYGLKYKDFFLYRTAMYFS